MNVVVPVRRAKTETELRLRVVPTPEPVTVQLLVILGPRLQNGTGEISNVVRKIPLELRKLLHESKKSFKLQNSG